MTFTCAAKKFDRSNFSLWAVLLIAVVMSTAACSKIKNDNNTAGSGHSDTSPASSSPSALPPSSSGGGKPTTWEANATSLNGKEGETMTLLCSPNGTPHTVWGSDIYTSDSSICTAAVHSGLITLQQGGTVTIEMRAGRKLE